MWKTCKTGKEIVRGFDDRGDAELSFADRQWLIKNIDETIKATAQPINKYDTDEAMLAIAGEYLATKGMTESSPNYRKILNEFRESWGKRSTRNRFENLTQEFIDNEIARIIELQEDDQGEKYGTEN